MTIRHGIAKVHNKTRDERLEQLSNRFIWSERGWDDNWVIFYGRCNKNLNKHVTEYYLMTE